MAKHMRQSKGKRIRNLVLLGAALCAAAGIAAGAVLASNAGNAVGYILPEHLILDEEQVLAAQPNGGFLLVTTNGTTDTNAMFLTRDGAVAEGAANYRSILGGLQRVFVQTDTAYIITGSRDGGMELGSILRIPLDGSQFANAEEAVFDNAVLQIDLESICADETGDCYAISRSSNRVLRLNLTDMESSVPLDIAVNEQILLDGLAIDDEVVYLSGRDAQGQNAVWVGTLFDDEILGVTKQTGVSAEFPLQFLSDTMVVDENNRLYTVSGGALTVITGTPTFTGAVDLDDTGTLAGITAENEIALFTSGDYTSAVGTYLYDGEICAAACNDGVAAILREEGRYRGVLLDDDDFGLTESEPEQIEPKPTVPESAEPEMTSSQYDDPIMDDVLSDGGSSAEEPEQEASSGISSEENSEVSSVPEAMTDRIYSSRFAVDPAAGRVTLPAGTTLAQFRKTVPLNGGAVLTAVTAEGNGFSGGKLGTGMRLQLIGGEELLDEVTVLVKGDLNGSGTVNSADQRLLYQHLTGEKILTDEYYTAADLDENGAVNTRDLLLLKQLDS